MAWEGSDRKQFLPSNWNSLRQKRFELDGFRCTFVDSSGRRCKRIPTDCDHLGDREDHRIEMLTSLCGWHHSRKSGRQGAAGRERRRRRRKTHWKSLRDEEHPGLL